MVARTEQGRFALGNAGGPGRPKRKSEAEYIAVLCEAVPLEEWRKVCERALKDALNGNAKARDFLAHYLIDNNLAARVEALETVLKLRKLEDDR
jgi:hypothetical protein